MLQSLRQGEDPGASPWPFPLAIAEEEEDSRSILDEFLFVFFLWKFKVEVVLFFSEEINKWVGDWVTVLFRPCPSARSSRFVIESTVKRSDAINDPRFGNTVPVCCILWSRKRTFFSLSIIIVRAARLFFLVIFRAPLTASYGANDFRPAKK